MIGGGALRGMNDAIKNNNQIRSKRKKFKSDKAISSGRNKKKRLSPGAIKALKAKAQRNKADTKRKLRVIAVLGVVLTLSVFYLLYRLLFA